MRARERERDRESGSEKERERKRERELEKNRDREAEKQSGKNEPLVQPTRVCSIEPRQVVRFQQSNYMTSNNR